MVVRAGWRGLRNSRTQELKPKKTKGPTAKFRIPTFWSAGVLECWSAGVLECWSAGGWSAGVLECWSTGVLECWSAVLQYFST